MADPKEPKRPAAPGSPEAPLPRLWKTEPDEEPPVPKKAEETSKKGKSAPEPARPAKSRRAAEKAAKEAKKKKDEKDAKDAKDGKEKSVLKEETPKWDTQEARERVRIIVGGGLFALLMIVGFVVAVRFFSNKSTDEPPAPDEIPQFTSTAPTQGQRDEEEARSYFNRAQEVAKTGNTTLAVAILKRVKTKYATTAAAKEASQALERPSQNLPLFLDRPAVVASPGDAPPAPEPAAPKEPVKTVHATQTPVPTNNSSTANLVLPANPAEFPVAPVTAPNQAPATSQARASKALPKGFQARSGTEIHESGWPMEIVGDRDGAPMALVPGGRFIQGRNNADANEGPEHHVALGT